MTMKAPETVVTQELVEKLGELLAKATSSCPETIEFASNAHEYWLNGVTRARIEIVEATPTLLATITTLQAELASARKVVEAARDYVEEAAGSPPLYSKEARAAVTANANAELKRIDAWLTANGGE